MTQQILLIALMKSNNMKLKKDKYGIPIKLEIGVYYMIQRKKIIYDIEEMENELQEKINNLPNIKIK